MNTLLLIPVSKNSTHSNQFAARMKAMIVVMLLLCIQVFSYAEGTKQIQPLSTDKGYFMLDNGWGTFALYNCPATSRLNISICNPGEIIYFGFKQSNNDVHFRIMDPFGT